MHNGVNKKDLTLNVCGLPADNSKKGCVQVTGCTTTDELKVVQGQTNPQVIHVNTTTFTQGNPGIISIQITDESGCLYPESTGPITSPIKEKN